MQILNQSDHGKPPYIIPPAASSGPNMDNNRAGRISVPVGMMSLTGARSMRRSTSARCAARISLPCPSSVSAKGGAKLERLRDGNRKRLERTHPCLARDHPELILPRRQPRLPRHVRAGEPHGKGARPAIAIQPQSGIERQPADNPSRTISTISDTSPSVTGSSAADAGHRRPRASAHAREKKALESGPKPPRPPGTRLSPILSIPPKQQKRRHHRQNPRDDRRSRHRKQAAHHTSTCMIFCE